MKLLFNLEYRTTFGEELVLNIPNVNGKTEQYKMGTLDGLHWMCEMSKTVNAYIDYYYTLVCGEQEKRHEFGHISPWITVGGYTVATLTAIDRVRRDRHHWYDVCAGAAIGVAATELTYYVSDLLFPPKQKNFSLGITPAGLDLVVRW